MVTSIQIKPNLSNPYKLQVQIDAFKSTNRAYVTTSNGQTAFDILSKSTNVPKKYQPIPVTSIEKNFVKNWLRDNPKSVLARSRLLFWGPTTVHDPDPAIMNCMMSLLDQIKYRTVEIENGVLFTPLIKNLGDLGGVGIARLTPTTVTLAHIDVEVLDGLVKRVDEVLGGLAVRNLSVSSVVSQLFKNRLLDKIHGDKSVSKHF